MAMLPIGLRTVPKVIAPPAESSALAFVEAIPTPLALLSPLQQALATKPNDQGNRRVRMAAWLGLTW